jgi:nucleoside-triphosphatase THEP1
MGEKLSELWAYLIAGSGTAAAALLASHQRVRDRVGRLEVKVEVLSIDVSESAEKVSETRDAVVRLEAASTANANAVEAALPKLDELLEQTRSRRERFDSGEIDGRRRDR